MQTRTLTKAERIRLVQLVVEGDRRRPALERLLARDARESLSAFVQQFFWVNDPGTELEWAWYHDLICRELERVTAAFERGERTRLVICIPPGCMKSIIVSVLWPAWWWLRRPETRFLALANKDDLAARDSGRMRNVLTTEWYKRVVEHLADMGMGPRWGLTRHQSAIKNFVNTRLGGRQTFGVTSKVTGFRGDGRIIDDPHDASDAMGTPDQVANALEVAHRFCDVVLPSRCNDVRRAFEVVVQQRLHENDVAGKRLASDFDHQRSVVLAAEFDPEDPNNHPEDPRTEAGELLDPERLPRDALDELKSDLESRYPGQAEAQYNQRPQPARGGMFKPAWYRNRYSFDFQRPVADGVFRPWDEVAVTVDCTFKRSTKADFVSVQAWGRWGWNFYLGDEEHGKLDYTELREVVRDFVLMHRPRFILIEEKANGAALISELSKEFSGVIPFVPDSYGDKVSRAAVTTVYWRAGNVWLPDEHIAPWIVDYLKELSAFPSGMYDDRVDAMSQLLIHWQELALTANYDAQATALTAIADMLRGGAPTSPVLAPQAQPGQAERRRERLKRLTK